MNDKTKKLGSKRILTLSGAALVNALLGCSAETGPEEPAPAPTMPEVRDVPATPKSCSESWGGQGCCGDGVGTIAISQSGGAVLCYPWAVDASGFCWQSC